MPKFKVYKGHDAWVVYSAVVEADSAEEANEIANSSDFRRNGDNWTSEDDVREFDHSEVFDDETEQLTEEGE